MKDFKELLISIKDLFKSVIELIMSYYTLGLSMMALLALRSRMNPVNWH